jgi:hypothetical protein
MSWGGFRPKTTKTPLIAGGFEQKDRRDFRPNRLLGDARTFSAGDTLAGLVCRAPEPRSSRVFAESLGQHFQAFLPPAAEQARKLVGINRRDRMLFA